MINLIDKAREQMNLYYDSFKNTDMYDIIKSIK